MAFNDPIGDLLTRIRNAQGRNHKTVSAPASKLRERVLNVLKAKGYISGFETVTHDDGKKDVVVTLKYFDDKPVIQEIARVSKPGRRVYSSVNDLKPYQNGLGVYIVSTPKGVMCDYDARANNVGGEVLASVY
tara:strand:- start:196 stop:594 length:399 start_codon:yes stop_codon:yes gene_type:complete